MSKRKASYDEEFKEELEPVVDMVISWWSDNIYSKQGEKSENPINLNTVNGQIKLNPEQAKVILASLANFLIYLRDDRIKEKKIIDEVTNMIKAVNFENNSVGGQIKLNPEQAAVVSASFVHFINILKENRHTERMITSQVMHLIKNADVEYKVN
ncbi:MAG: hypothetical protein FWG87_08675 [Defluviitaleaceae bacterium]|nr:hypothetical protein [Defluviitaleaceae bacterium]